MEDLFHLKERKTNVKTEILAGITTFMTMSYILAVNPLILSEAGMDQGGVFTATIITSIVATIAMALLANYPFALSAGMGINVMFTYSIVKDMGHSWQFALTAVFVGGMVFILLSLVKFREAIFNVIPANLKRAISVGIGLYIALIGMFNSGLVVRGEGTVLTLGELKSPGVLVTLFGLLVIGVLSARRVNGAILYGIVSSTILAILLGVTQLPDQVFALPPSLGPVAFQLEFHQIATMDMAIVVFTLLFAEVFDSVGTLVGVATKADMLDEKGELPKVGQALFADALGTVLGSLLGTSNVKTYLESATGVAQGGRTGLTALTVAGLFLVSLFFYPLFAIIPFEATAPALIVVGLYMMGSVVAIDFSDVTEALPAFLTMVLMPFSYSVAEGIMFGLLSYVLLKVLSGRAREITGFMWFLTLIFALRIYLI